MRIFTKFTFICNLCFIASFIMRFINLGHLKTPVNFNVVELHPIESSIVVLGFTAMFFNLLYLALIIIATVRKTSGIWKQSLLYLNLFFFMLELLFWFY